MIKGKENDLNDFLKTFKVTPLDIKKPTTVLFHGEQVNLSHLNSLGLKSSEKTSSFKLSSDGKSVTDFSDYLVIGHQTNKDCYINNQCTSNLKCFDTSNTVTCKKAFVFYSSDGEIEVQVPLKVLDRDQKRVDYPD